MRNFFREKKQRLGPIFSRYTAYLEFCTPDATLDGTIKVTGTDLVGVGAITIFFLQIS